MDKVKHAALVKPEVKRAPEVKKSTFEEVWKSAQTVCAKLNEQEPEATKKAISRLGGIDADMARAFADILRGTVNPTKKDLGLLAKFELDDLLRRIYRDQSFLDDSLKFKMAMGKLWNPELNPSHVIAAAEIWGSLEYETATDAIFALERNVKPSTTNGVRAIESLPGGDAWLEKLK